MGMIDRSRKIIRHYYSHVCRAGLYGFITCGLTLYLVATGGVRAQSANIQEEILAGCEPDYPPYSIVDAEGQADGFSVELLRAVLETMGDQVVYRVDEWSRLKEDLAEGRIRVLPLMGKTPEREAIYDFTFPYLTMHGTLVVRKDQDDIRTPDDLKGRRVAVLKGDNAEEYLLRVNLGAEIVSLPSFETALRELSAGRYDAVVIQRLLALQLIQQSGITNLKTVGLPIADFKQTFCFAVRKGDNELLAQLNEGLSIAMIDGTFRALTTKWFGAINRIDTTFIRVVVGGDMDFPPYEFLDERGQPSGFNVDLTRAIAQHMGIEVRFELGGWGDVRKGLENGTISMVQSMVYSEAREKTYDFSPPHSSVQYVVATRKNAPKFSHLEELSDKRILVMKGSIMHDLALQQGYTTNLITVVTQEEALRALSEGAGDCALVGKTSAHFWIAKNKWSNLKLSDHPVLSAECCFAVLPENKFLADRFAEGLTILKETGEYRRIETRWLSPYESRGFSFKSVLIYVALVAIPLAMLLVGSILWSRSLRRQVVKRTAELASEAEGHGLAEVRAQSALEQTKYLLKDAEKARYALLSVVEDQKATAKKLSDSEKRFRSLYNSMSEGVAIHRIAYDAVGKAIDYEVESVNPAYEKLFGLKAKHLVGKKASELVGEQNMLSLAVCVTVAETGQPQRFEVSTPNRERSFSVSLSSPGKGYFAVLFEDITERNKAEADHMRLMAAIEQSGEIVVITDSRGVVLYVNPAFVAARGYALEEVVGKKLGAIKSGENDDALYQEMWKTISEGGVWMGRFINRRKDGTLYTEETTISPVFDRDGTIINYAAAGRDITGQLRLAEQLHQSQRLESIGRLAGGVAHDFNNMLGVIIGNAELAMDRVQPDDPIFSEIQEIRRAAERSAGLTRQLLAFARKQTVAPQVIDLNDAVGSTLKMLRRLIGEAIELVWNPGARNATIKIDPSQMDQVLTNLTVNARDAISGVGKISIKTSRATFDSEFCDTHPGASLGDYVLLAVSDTGCGMDEKTMVNIFEPFFTTKGLGAGTGLGLSTVYGIVQQNKGFISVHSELDVGTTFQIYFPLYANFPETDNGAQPQPKVRMGNETVLLVEDEEAILKMSTTMLKNLGYVVFSASSPDAAVKFSEEFEGKIDLLLTDMIMPVMNGYELSKKLLARSAKMKCIFMSGYTADVINNENILEDGIHFIQKPFSIRELAAKIREALDKT